MQASESFVLRFCQERKDWIAAQGFTLKGRTLSDQKEHILQTCSEGHHGAFAETLKVFLCFFACL